MRMKIVTNREKSCVNFCKIVTLPNPIGNGNNIVTPNPIGNGNTVLNPIKRFLSKPWRAVCGTCAKDANVPTLSRRIMGMAEKE